MVLVKGSAGGPRGGMRGSMELSQTTNFNASQVNGLPSDTVIEEAFQRVIEQVLALKEALA